MARSTSFRSVMTTGGCLPASHLSVRISSVSIHIYVSLFAPLLLFMFPPQASTLALVYRFAWALSCGSASWDSLASFQAGFGMCRPLSLSISLINSLLFETQGRCHLQTPTHSRAPRPEALLLWQLRQVCDIRARHADVLPRARHRGRRCSGTDRRGPLCTRSLLSWLD